MARGDPGLFVDYCAKDFLDGTQFLTPWEELAYRRICDLIYDSNDHLPDDDRMLAWATKTGRRWPQIRAVLMGGDHPKLTSESGFIRNKRCSLALSTAAQKIAQKAIAGRASAATGKSLINLQRARTDVPVAVPVAVPNGDPNGLRTTHISNKKESSDSSLRSESAKADPVKALFDRGVRLMTASGVSEPQARSLIGKWRRDFGDGLVTAAVANAENESATDPVSFIAACLKRRKGEPDKPERPKELWELQGFGAPGFA